MLNPRGGGSCPICGMVLEPVDITAEAGANNEPVDMTRRFWVGAALSVPVVVLEMGGHIFNLHHLVSLAVSTRQQFAFVSPVGLWAGWPFFQHAWVTLAKCDLMGVARAHSLSRTTGGRGPFPEPGVPAQADCRRGGDGAQFRLGDCKCAAAAQLAPLTAQGSPSIYLYLMDALHYAALGHP